MTTSRFNMVQQGAANNLLSLSPGGTRTHPRWGNPYRPPASASTVATSACPFRCAMRKGVLPFLCKHTHEHGSPHAGISPSQQYAKPFEKSQTSHTRLHSESHLSTLTQAPTALRTPNPIYTSRTNTHTWGNSIRCIGLVHPR